jgi:glycosyltransferase involved in cell wall biosynthesis
MASYRALGFCRNFAQFGWEPIVICEDWPSHAKDYDDGIINQNDKFEVFRIKSYGPKGIKRALIRNFFPWIWPHKTPLNWWSNALDTGRKLCCTRKIDAIFATHDPLSALSVASLLSAEFNIPWVADLRDSWNVQVISSPLKQKLIEYHEKKLCLEANSVVTVCEKIAQKLQKDFGKKVHFIGNGFDELDASRNENQIDEKFRILYAGSFSSERQNPSVLVQAINNCISVGRIPAKTIEICFLGLSRDSLPDDLWQELDQISVKVKERVPRREALLEMQLSSLLWVIPHTQDKGVLTGKIFDYLSTGRVIICVPDDCGEINRLIEKTKIGFSSSNPCVIAEEICRYYDMWCADKNFITKLNLKELSKHSRLKKTEELSNLLNDLESN